MDNRAPVVLEAATLKDALIEITDKKLGITLVSNGEKITGKFKDGELIN